MQKNDIFANLNKTYPTSVDNTRNTTELDLSTSVPDIATSFLNLSPIT